jgi:hypothetical protein
MKVWSFWKEFVNPIVVLVDYLNYYLIYLTFLFDLDFNLVCFDLKGYLVLKVVFLMIIVLANRVKLLILQIRVIIVSFFSFYSYRLDKDKVYHLHIN